MPYSHIYIPIIYPRIYSYEYVRVFVQFKDRQARVGRSTSVAWKMTHLLLNYRTGSRVSIYPQHALCAGGFHAAAAAAGYSKASHRAPAGRAPPPPAMIKKTEYTLHTAVHSCSKTGYMHSRRRRYVGRGAQQGTPLVASSKKRKTILFVRPPTSNKSDLLIICSSCT